MGIVIIRIGKLVEVCIGIVENTNGLVAVEELQHEWSIALKWWDWMHHIHINQNEIDLLGAFSSLWLNSIPFENDRIAIANWSFHYSF